LLGSWALASEPEFLQATPGRPFVFALDHGKHPGFQTEWWYFTGNLKSPQHRWGFQLTFFRRSLVKKAPRNSSAWAVTDLYPAHFAITNGTDGRFFGAELLSREGPGLAGASNHDLNVFVKDWSAVRNGDAIDLKARQEGYRIDLRLSSEKPIVLHGDRGYSRKGDSAEQASYYYSLTRLRAEGSLSFDGKTHEVKGVAWMDHEFGSSMLLHDQAGWDWFSLQLEDDTELMVFRLRKKDGSSERPFGTFVTRDGAVIDLAHEKIIISSTGSWKSPHTTAVYPSGWRIEIPGRNLALTVNPVMADQEHAAATSTSVIYWEGAVTAKGVSDGKSVHGSGYVELTGYAHSMGGKL